MNNLDIMIRYLSGELSEKEIQEFQERLEGDPEFKEQFEDASSAWDLIRKNLQEKDEEAFRLSLKNAMEKRQEPSPEDGRKRLSWLKVLLPVAAAVILALVIFLPGQRHSDLFGDFYDPEADPLVHAMIQESRNQAGEVRSLYLDQRYTEVMEQVAPLLAEAPENLQYQLCFLLSAIQIDRQEEALELLIPILPESGFASAQAIHWYLAMAFLKSERYEEALDLLKGLERDEGPYFKKAEKLKKLLSK